MFIRQADIAFLFVAHDMYLERRKEDTVRNDNEMIEETMGPIISIMSET